MGSTFWGGMYGENSRQADQHASRGWMESSSGELEITQDKDTALSSQDCRRDPTSSTNPPQSRGTKSDVPSKESSERPTAGSPDMHSGMPVADLRSTEGDSPPPIQQIGPYRVITELAQGGTATVYVCQQTSPARFVALKLLHAGPDPTAQLKKRFQLEIQLLATLSHSGIAQIFDAGVARMEVGLRPYFTMELVHGMRLHDFLRSRTSETATLQNTLELFLKVCDAVHYAHCQGVVHRDLKPSNILVDTLGRPKIIDFGIARLQPPPDSMETVPTLTMATVGTPPYMSPEQFAEDARLVDARSDIYSLAVVFYEALAGRMPYDVHGKPFYEVARMIREVAPTPLRRINAALGPDLDVVIQKGLAKDANDRYSSVQAFAEDLRRCMLGQPVLARPIGPLTQITKWSRRNPQLAFLATGSIAALTVTTVLAVLFGLTAQRHAVELRKTVNLLVSEQQHAAEHANIADRHRVELQATNDELKELVHRSQHHNRNATIVRAQQKANEDPALARSLLHNEAMFPPNARNFSWNLLDRLTDRQIQEWKAHSTSVDHLAFSGDGRVIASVALQSVSLWQAADGTKLHRIQERIGRNSRVALNEAGTRVLVLREDGAVFVWRVPEWDKIPLRNSKEEPATAIAFSPDGEQVAVGDRTGHVQVWGRDLAQPSWKAQLTQKPVACLRFALTTNQLGVISSDGECHITDAGTGESLEHQQLPLVAPHSFELSSDLHWIASTRPQGNCILWDRHLGVEAQRVGPSGQFPCVQILTESEPILLSSRRTRVELWRGDERTTVMSSSPAAVRSLAVSPDQARIAMGREDGTVVVCSTKTSPPIRSIATQDNVVVQVRFSEDSRYLATTGRGERVVIHDVVTGDVVSELPGHEPPVRDASFCPKSTHVITTDRHGSLRKWDFRSGALEISLDPPGERVRAMARTSQGDLLYCLGAKGNLFSYSLSEGSLITVKQGEMASGIALALSPDGRQLATADENGELFLWDTEQLVPIMSRKLDELRIVDLDFSKDGRFLVTASADGLPGVWEVPNLKPIQSLQLHSTRVRSLDFSPDGTLLATGGADGRVILWDTDIWEPQLTLDDEIKLLRVVRFSPDGRRLAIGGQGGQISLWEAASTAAP